MGYRFRSHARRRALGAALAALAWVLALGTEVAVPAVALVALVYFAHQVAAAALGDSRVPHPGLALVIVLNSLVVLGVQALVFVLGGRGT